METRQERVTIKLKEIAMMNDELIKLRYKKRKDYWSPATEEKKRKWSIWNKQISNNYSRIATHADCLKRWGISIN